MAIYSLVGNDTLILNGAAGGNQVSITFNDFADGDAFNLEMPNELGAIKTGKDGNSVFAFNNTGRNGSATLRLIRGSDDDASVNSLMAAWENDPTTFTLLSGSFTKNVGDGAGVLKTDKYNLAGGIFTKIPAVSYNAEGGTNQGVSIYTIKFSNVSRSIS